MAVVISSGEYQRLRNSLTDTDASHKPTNDIPGSNHSKSKRVEKWTDTVAARKTRHEIEREERLKREEEQRQKIDILEAQSQLKRRQEAIERANDILYVFFNQDSFSLSQFEGK